MTRVQGVSRPRRGRLVAALTAALVVAAPAVADAKRRPAGLPPAEGLSSRSLAATFAAERVLLAVRNQPVSERTLLRHGARPIDPVAGIWEIAGRHAPDAARALDRNGLLRYLQPDRANVRETRSTSTDPLDPTRWWVPFVGADRVSPPGPGVPLTVVDDGLDMTHPEFAGRRETRLLNAHDTRADDGHGTMVASVAAASLNGLGVSGLYPQMRLRSADIRAGTCGAIVSALRSAVAAGSPGVINLSLGFPRASDCYPLYDAVMTAFGTGQLVVASAGNDGRTRDNFPASYPHVITVAASDANDVASGFSTASLGVDLAAPGEAIPVAAPFAVDPLGYASVDGTSFSAPLVAAAASWAWTARRSEIRDVTQLFELVRSSARDVGEEGWESGSGFGVLDLPALLSKRVPVSDGPEPNDDVDQVRAGGLFRQAMRPLLARGQGRASVSASVDWVEDPVDVYRVWAPPGRGLNLRVTTDADVDLEVFRPTANTVYYGNRRAALRGALIGGSYRTGAKAEQYSVRNSTRRGAYVYVCVYKARDGRMLDAVYDLTASIAR